MGFFDRFRRKPPAASGGPVTLTAVAAGRIVRMGEIPDEVFAQGILGQCCGIDPTEGSVYAPCDGRITQVPDTLHALGLSGHNGVEVLLHVGVDTVEMKGAGFTAWVKAGDPVQQGQKLLTMDLDRIRAAGHPAVVITVVTNSDDFSNIDLVAEGTVAPGDAMLRVSK